MVLCGFSVLIFFGLLLFFLFGAFWFGFFFLSLLNKEADITTSETLHMSLFKISLLRDGFYSYTTHFSLPLEMTLNTFIKNNPSQQRLLMTFIFSKKAQKSCHCTD